MPLCPHKWSDWSSDVLAAINVDGCVRGDGRDGGRGAVRRHLGGGRSQRKAALSLHSNTLMHPQSTYTELPVYWRNLYNLLQSIVLTLQLKKPFVNHPMLHFCVNSIF